MKLQRKLIQWINCDPRELSLYNPSASERVFEDAKADILTMAKLLCEAGYPRRNTPEENQTIQDFATKVQALIPHADAVEL